MLQGFLVALVSALIYLESRLVGQHMLDRPIIIGPVVGLIMGERHRHHHAAERRRRLRPRHGARHQHRRLL